MIIIPDYKDRDHVCQRCKCYDAKFLVPLTVPNSPASAVAPLCQLCAESADPIGYEQILAKHNPKLISEAIASVSEVMGSIPSDTTTWNYLSQAVELLRIVSAVCYSDYIKNNHKKESV